jgi:hypothetical protein
MSVPGLDSTAARPAAPLRYGPCRHTPRCPGADAPDCYGARVLAAHPEQGWSLLCNRVIVFDDLGAVLPGPERRLVLALANR